MTVALRERLDRVRRSRVDICYTLDRLRAEYSTHAVDDARTPDEIIGYDEAGLPR